MYWISSVYDQDCFHLLFFVFYHGYWQIVNENFSTKYCCASIFAKISRDSLTVWEVLEFETRCSIAIERRGQQLNDKVRYRYCNSCYEIDQILRTAVARASYYLSIWTRFLSSMPRDSAVWSLGIFVVELLPEMLPRSNYRSSQLVWWWVDRHFPSPRIAYSYSLDVLRVFLRRKSRPPSSVQSRTFGRYRNFATGTSLQAAHDFAISMIKKGLWQKKANVMAKISRGMLGSYIWKSARSMGDELVEFRSVLVLDFLLLTAYQTTMI